ncbi:MAG: lysine--tRNA ligase [Candidatus Aenigmarchaeota archaeon]|nr:lysine--tRNA ligase [Candidatus Aenigmarchaeota archaeon]
MVIKRKQKDYTFWTDKIADDIIHRKMFHYTEDKIPKFKKFVVKTSASISGVLHIGRLSDTIRGDAAFKSLDDAGVKAELIWVAEDMDPLRKVPEGVPKNYSEYIGMPVTDIPDPTGCHKSYAEHHVSEYFKVLDRFVSTKMEKFSMREDYRKGEFNKYIKIMLAHIEELKDIQNKYRRNELSGTWSPWTPICDNCGKIITPKVIGFEKGKVSYKCEDYKFEKYVAVGCGHEGDNNPLKGNGKLLWKSEWAAQWARWDVCSEGAGKEYQVPGSAFWINGEIAEKILKFPMPVPIFYEHLTINGEKMSASIGNVVYPNEWLNVAPPELLRLIFLKDPSRVRDFRWEFVPNMMDEMDELAKVYFDVKKLRNERDNKTMKRLFEIIQLGKPPSDYRPNISYNLFLEIAKILPEENQLEFTINKLKELGHLKKVTNKTKNSIKERLEFAKNFNENFVKVAKVEVRLNQEEKFIIHDMITIIKDEDNADELQTKIFSLIKKHNSTPKEFFKMVYRILLNSDTGPKLGHYIIDRGKDEVIKKLKDSI